MAGCVEVVCKVVLLILMMVNACGRRLLFWGGVEQGGTGGSAPRPVGGLREAPEGGPRGAGRWQQMEQTTHRWGSFKPQRAALLQGVGARPSAEERGCSAPVPPCSPLPPPPAPERTGQRRRAPPSTHNTEAPSPRRPSG